MPSSKTLGLFLLLFSALCTAAMTSGCGPSAGGVALTGHVTFDGKAIEDGLVTLIPLEGTSGTAVGTNIKGGAFSLDRLAGPLPGRYRVEFKSFVEPSTADSAKAKAKAAAKAKANMNTVLFGQDPEKLPAGSAISNVSAGRLNEIPERYNTQSELTAVIPAAASYDIRFELAK